MYCPKCGKENRDQARFCVGCGNPLKQPSVTPKIQNQGRTAGPAAPDSAPQSQPAPVAPARKPAAPAATPQSQPSRPATPPSHPAAPAMPAGMPDDDLDRTIALDTPEEDDELEFTAPQSQPSRPAAPPRKPAAPAGQPTPQQDSDDWVNEIQIEYKEKPLAEEAQSSGPQQPKKKKRWGLIALAAVLVALLAAGGVAGTLWILKSRTASESQEDKEEETTQEETQEESGEEAEEEETEEESAAQEEEAGWAVLENQVPANSSQDEGNLFGNTLCYARMASDGDTLYFRNPLANEAIYARDEDGAVNAVTALDGIYMKDMHFLDGYFYYCKTGKGDVSGIEPDMNLYRVKPDGTGLQKLTDISYTGSDGWLSFDTIVDGKCYFAYYTGDQLGYRIARVGVDGTGFEELFMIPGAECDGLPQLNVADGNIYYWKADGLNCLNIQSGTNTLAVGGFKCEEYWIYGGKIYYTAGTAQGEGGMKIKTMNLDGTDIQVIFAATADQSWMKLIQANIYRDRIYFIGRSDSEDAQISGQLFSCKLDGADFKTISPKATWFNIVDSVLYYRFDNYADVEASRKEPIYRLYIGDLENNQTAAAESIFDPADYNQGWVQQGVSWYYYENGTMAKDTWKEIEGSSYYFGSDGAMYADTTTPDGYTVGPDGVWVQ